MKNPKGFTSKRERDYANYITRKAKEFGWSIPQTVRYFKTGQRPKTAGTVSGIIARRGNPKGWVKIYSKVTRIECQKGSDSKFPGERFFHNFSKPYPSMYGSVDRKTLIIKKG